MTSRDLVIKTLEMKSPPRAPRDLWTLPWAHSHYPDAVKTITEQFPSDFAGPSYSLAQYPKTSGNAYEMGTYIDEWGCIFQNMQPGVIGEVKEPIIREEDWSDAEKVQFPRELLTVNIDQVNRSYLESDKFMTGGCCPRPFERLQFLRGTEQLYIDFMELPSKMERFIALLHEFYCEQMHVWAKTNVDGLNFMDDWGAQRSLLINPAIWRAIFKPMYKDYIDIAHSAGKKIFMHSDGYIVDILPDLIDLGLDAINSQIFCMGLDKLKPFAGKITFWGEIDRQHLLPYGTEQDIETAVRNVKDTLWQNGGCIAQLEFGIGARPENVLKVFETWDSLFELRSAD